MSSSIEKARKLRKNMTDAETKLWQLIRKRQVLGFKFRKQAPIGPFIADFVCFEKKLIIEIDGGQHKIVRLMMKKEPNGWYRRDLK